MRKLALALLLASLAAAQKKPITLDTLDEVSRDESRAVVWSPDGRSFAFRENGNLMLYDAGAQKSKALIAVKALEAAASKISGTDGPFDWTNRREHRGGLEWSHDGKYLLYIAGGDIFLVDVESGNWRQLTNTPAAEIDPKLSPDGKKVAFRRGWDLYVVDVQSKEEVRLTSGGTATLRNGAPDWVYPEELGLGTAFWWSPDSNSIAYLQFDTSPEPMFPHEDLLPARAIFEPEPYPQAGENNAAVRLGIVPASGGATRWLNIDDTRDTYLIARAGWMPDSRHVYTVRMNRVQNRLETFAIDIESGESASLFRESDPYWINLRGDLQFLEDGKYFLWTSERDGYRHIYLYSNDGKEVKQLTRGDWEVSGINAVDEDGGRIFYTSSEPSHLERHLYAVGLDGRTKRRLTTEPGSHEISIAPNGAYYLDTWSSLNEPPRTVLHSGDGKMLAVYREPDRKQGEYDVLPTEIVKFNGPDGTLLYGRLTKPAGFRSGNKYPVVATVYGGPDAALPARNAWPGINIEQVFAHKGYIVWQAENRGGSGRGHAFETAIFHKLGLNELADQVAGIRYLISLGFADPQRVGIHGWSYGGFMTVNALLNAPDVFHAGFAGAAVTSWLNYDTIYTERYMGLPKDNPRGYEETALPRNAGKLSGKLMLAHNAEDDNVLFQNMLQLTNALQLAGKQFEMMVYPQKTHHVSGAAERQMNQMMLDFFDRNLK